MKVGLRIDVDTYRGTRRGVPSLSRLLAQHGIKATFFFSVGPDNMGRHLWRLLRPAFLWKMLRTRASQLYGWDILLRGTLWPGPIIGKRLCPVIRSVAQAGHETGLHTWDHHAWQAHIESMDRNAIYQSISQGVSLLSDILGRPPDCSAVPGWKCNNLVLKEKQQFPFRYNSDCRGNSIFLPLIDGQPIGQPQVPVTLPTYDEVIGHEGICAENYNDYLLSLIKPAELNVLTIHAEVEGIVCLEMFGDFLNKAEAQGISFCPLGDFLNDSPPLHYAEIVNRNITGRQGWVSCQGACESISERKENSIRNALVGQKS
ncbi:MAG: 4-deoxy-4-formamido-L-arabinose-phosphoundecaprenol deformylase [Sedimentisphaerales bacterium]|nr:4-deoxy-4-formamido-L-arabinose-phosphoundecaprenol deformylase [Sedimentisphaerales bacterium]